MLASESKASLISETVKTILHFEGYRAAPYRDNVGVWTVGGGLTVINGKKVTRYTKATPSQLRAAMIDHIKNDLKILNRLQGFKKLNINQRRALLSLAYNVGVNALARGNILKGLRAQNMHLIINTILQYKHAGGRVVNGLKKRRKIEVSIFTTPVKTSIKKGAFFKNKNSSSLALFFRTMPN